MNESLNEIFDVSPEPRSQVITRAGQVVVKNDTTDNNIDADYVESRNNLYSLLAQGQDALMSALEVAKQSENPNAFAVVGTLMKQLADVNHQLLGLSERKQRMSDKKERSQDSGQPIKQVQNNTVFVGSTSDLHKMLNDMKGE